MRVEKLKKSDYTDLYKFYERISVTDVCKVNVSSEDYAKFVDGAKVFIENELNLKPAKFRRKMTQKRIAYQVGIMMFDIGPSQRLCRLVQPGYCLIED